MRSLLCPPWHVVCLAAVVVLVFAKAPSPPMMIRQPGHEQPFQVSEDEVHKPVVLECEAEGNPEPKYEWTKNGRAFHLASNSSISKQPQRGTLVFSRPQSEDEGLYQCRASNVHGTSLSNAVFLRKSVFSNFIDDSTQEIFVTEGDPLTLDCKPPQGYPPPLIRWLMQSQSGKRALRSFTSPRMISDPEGKLHFSKVLRSDAIDDAVYVCSATSYFRREYKIGNKVILRVEPKSSAGETAVPLVLQFTSAPQQNALRFKRHQLYCIFGGTPLPRIEWSKNRNISLADSNRTTITNYGKTLVINSADFEDEGTYECTATNGVGSPLTHSVNVKINAAPYWMKSPEPKNAAVAETVTFECNAGGDPKPKLQWFINGVPIEELEPNSRRKLEGNFLTIERLEREDTAVLQCNASNPLGYAFNDFYLNVASSAPPNVMLHYLTT